MNGRVLTAGDVEAIAEATARRLVEIVSSPPRTLGFVGARKLRTSRAWAAAQW
jgi:hypothetical protein